MKKVLVLAFGMTFVTGAFADFANPSFETGDFTGWTTQSAQNGSLYGVTASGFDGINASDGTQFAYFGAVADQNDVISQTLSTTNGGQYVLSFDMGNGSTSGGDNFEVSVNGNDLFNGVAPPVNNGTMTHFTFNVTGTGSDTFAFGGRNPPAYTGLDNVHLTAVPEPATYAVLGVGALALIRRRRSK